ncbi:hypothetical protein GCM10023160_07490 [Brachybacterium paraconglomeratum]
MVMGMHSEAPLSPVRGVSWWAVRGAALLALVVAGGTAFAALGGDAERRGEVVRVIDGDTLIALIDGEETTVRLLNVDTPETKHPDEEVQCLGPEATAFLTERLPAGTEIELEYDQERLDRYDRTLAGVYESESLINAEIAAAGLGIPVYFAPNDRFLPDVEQASKEAQKKQAGLFSAEIECTLPAQLQAQSAAVEQVPATIEGDPGDALAGATTVLEELDLFITGLEVAGLPSLGNAVLAGPLLEPYLEGLRGDADELREQAESAHGTLDELKNAYDIEQERLEQERLEEERRQEEERLEQERIEEERRQEEERLEREEQERKEREEREEREKQPAQKSSGSKSSGSTGSSSGGSSSSTGSSGSSGSSGGSSSGGKSSGGGSSSCVPYGPEIPHADAGGYTGKRYGMPGGKTFRKCS